MKYIFSIFLALFIIGCGGGGSASDLDNADDVLIHEEYNNSNIYNEPLYYQQWYLDYNQTFYEDNDINKDANIHPSDILQYYSAKGVKIAIIDDYLDVNQEDLKDGIYSTYSIITHSNKLEYNNGDYHGTAVTGIIGARLNEKGILGVAYNSDLIFIQYKDNITDSEMVEMFEKAKDLGAWVINCSWGTYDVSDTVRDEINDLATNGRNGKGIIIVFSAGNDNKNLDDAGVNDESEISTVISVGATNKNNLRSAYSNYGSSLDVMAPGGYWYGLTTTDIMGSDGYSNGDYDLYDDIDAFAGTSAAAPIVTGIVALLLEHNSSLTRDDIMNIIKNKSDKIGNLEYIDGRNDYYGYGKVNISNYLQ